MRKEYQEVVDLIAPYMDELKERLAAIEVALAAPSAIHYSDTTLTGIVDDVIRCNVQLNDLSKYLASRLIREAFGEVLARRGYIL